MIHWKEFFQFEEQNGLFQLEEEGFFIWDILRLQVYLDYMWEDQMNLVSRKKTSHKIRLSFSRILYLAIFLFKKSKPNLFFVNSRDKTPDGRYYDKNANDFLERLYRDSHIIETHQVKPRKYLYPISILHPVTLFNQLLRPFYKRKDYTFILNKINGSLGLRWDNKGINRIINDFKSETLFYTLLFRYKKVKRVFVVQNGAQKALFHAAKKRNIQTIEFQHGIIDQGHIAYNYPPGITAQAPIYVPDILLTFSPFWGRDINYPVGQILPMGNNSFARPGLTPLKSAFEDKHIGFISADVFGRTLTELAKEYAALHPDETLLFKLHPNEFIRKKEYVSRFSQFPNVMVITDDYPTETLMLICDAFVMIQSTLAYEALQLKKPVFIYKQMTYYRHEHIFDHPNVLLIDRAEEIIVPGNINKNAYYTFFEKFDENAYNQFTNTH